MVHFWNFHSECFSSSAGYLHYRVPSEACATWVPGRMPSNQFSSKSWTIVPAVGGFELVLRSLGLAGRLFL
jgi:hypothetical protein